MLAADRISQDAMGQMRAAISDAGGDEVVFVCRLDAELIVTEVDVVATGAADMAPAPLPLLQRGQIVIHNHPTGVLRPSRADVHTAAALGDTGVGSYIVNNEVTELVVVCEPLEPKELQMLDVDALSEHLDDGGALSTLFADYEPRASQMQMLRYVADSFNQSAILAVEAGTGVGKSFAYLIPAVAWAAANDERIVISTATINLQQQLVEKDIPAVKEILGLDVPAVLVKGRGNYLCRKRLAEALDEATLFEEPEEELLAIREWSKTEGPGSRSDAPFFPSEELWARVNSDADSCTEQSCRLRDDCFFLKARREAASARILVANHHLLFIDLSLRLRGIGFEARAILPPFQRLIFDEAHNIENSATSLFSDSFSIFSVRKHTRRLRRERRGKQAGLLPLVRMRGADAAAVNKAIAAVDQAEAAAQDLDTAVAALCEDPALRLTPQMDPGRRDALLGPVGELHTRIVGLSSALTDLIELNDDDEEGGPFYDLRVATRRIDRVAGLCRSFLEFEENPDRVFWIDYKRSAAGLRFARFVSTPLDIREIMRDAVFEAFETVVFTSATLTVAEEFDFWATRIGLLDTSRECEMVSLPSPFPFSENAILAVPTDAPLPSSADYQEFLSGFVGDLLELSEGHALVLFTSYEMLRRTYESTRDRLNKLGISSLRQGEDDRSRLLQRFNADASSVLFATESFWQGVDAPGDALQVVVLCRLPFRVPTDPVLTARTEMIELHGGNAFTDLALPEAVMKLRQGFGRLIRRASDRGAVVITDVRVRTKPYGEYFLRSLPETQESFKSAVGVLEDVERFLYQ
jgi:ATP-dependent DNA helicase DinG